MKVVLIFRRPYIGAHSIEALFSSIYDELENEIHIEKYIMTRRYFIFRDLINLWNKNADIYHITGDINYLAFFLPFRKTVLTVHDIGHYLFDLSGIKKYLYKWLWLILPIRLARTVTTVSEHSALDIERYLGISRTGLRVIENCYSPTIRYKQRSFNIEQPRILQVGTGLNKNVARLVAALEGIACKLVLVGKPDVKILNLIKEKNIDAEIVHGITGAEIADAYCECDIVTFISTNEGFGLPIIEAQASGRALITSNVSPMNAVAGKKACVVSPLDIGQIKSGILHIISDEGYRNKLIVSGLVNAKRFSVKNISQKYLQLYTNVVILNK